MKTESKVCPHCGYCDHCGRHPYRTYPYVQPWVYPNPYTQPYVKPYPVIWNNQDQQTLTANSGGSSVWTQAGSAVN